MKDIFAKLGLAAIILLFVISFIPKAHAGADKEVSDALGIPKSIELDTPLTFMSGDIDTWTAIGAFTRNSPINEITFRISGIGGFVMEANKFIESVLDAKAKGKIINMDVVGEAYSAHAFITCAASSVHIRDGASLMFHAASYTKSYLFGLVEYQDDNTDPPSAATQEKIFNLCKKSGMLSDEDINYIKHSGDVTFISSEGQIKKLYYLDPDRKTKLATDIVSLIIGLSVLMLLIALAKRI